MSGFPTRRGESGYSLVELLVGLAIFSVIAAGFMAVMFSVARSTDATADSVRISEEARLGLNRLVRDVREAGWIDLSSTSAAGPHDSFTVKIDYDGDGAYANPASGTAQGSYEIVTYTYDDPGNRITLTAPGTGTETLVTGVDCVRNDSGACKGPVFSFTSNRLEYDWSGDGVTTVPELDQAACNGVTTLDPVCQNNTLVEKELASVTNVNVAVALTVGGRKTNYYGEAQLRNRR